MKCEVLKDCVIQVKKGSIIEVSERQFELARRVLKPVEIKTTKAVPVEEVEKEEAPKRRKKKAEEVTAEE